MASDHEDNSLHNPNCENILPRLSYRYAKANTTIHVAIHARITDRATAGETQVA